MIDFLKEEGWAIAMFVPLAVLLGYIVSLWGAVI